MKLIVAPKVPRIWRWRANFFSNCVGRRYQLGKQIKKRCEQGFQARINGERLRPSIFLVPRRVTYLPRRVGQRPRVGQLEGRASAAVVVGLSCSELHISRFFVRWRHEPSAQPGSHEGEKGVRLIKAAVGQSRSPVGHYWFLARAPGWPHPPAQLNHSQFNWNELRWTERDIRGIRHQCGPCSSRKRSGVGGGICVI